MSLSSSSTDAAQFPPQISRDWHFNSAYQGPAATPDAQGRSGAWIFNSQHQGGVHFLFNDGGVKFLSQTMDYRLFCLLNYIHDDCQISAPGE